MSNRVSELFLFDVLINILKIEKIVSNYDNINDLKYDFMAWDSLMREFQIIGEASRKLIDYKIFEKQNREIVDFRNIIVHHYFGIDEEAVWGVIEEDLPRLKALVIEKIGDIDTHLRKELVEDTIQENRGLEFIIPILRRL